MTTLLDAPLARLIAAAGRPAAEAASAASRPPPLRPLRLRWAVHVRRPARRIGRRARLTRTTRQNALQKLIDKQKAADREPDARTRRCWPANLRHQGDAEQLNANLLAVKTQIVGDDRRRRALAERRRRARRHGRGRLQCGARAARGPGGPQGRRTRRAQGAPRRSGSARPTTPTARRCSRRSSRATTSPTS